MTYDLKTASVLSGLTVNQLRDWAADGTLEPEYSYDKTHQYSFRDLIAARTLGLLRSEFSAQAIKKAIKTLRSFDLTDHLAEYKIGHDGKVIVLEDRETDQILNLSKQNGQYRIFKLSEIWGSFTNFNGETVPPLEHPRPGITVNPERLGGWPTVGNSRIGYDLIANLVDGTTVTIEDIKHFYPTVSTSQAEDAIDLYKQVRAA